MFSWSMLSVFLGVACGEWGVLVFGETLGGSCVVDPGAAARSVDGGVNDPVEGLCCRFSGPTRRGFVWWQRRDLSPSHPIFTPCPGAAGSAAVGNPGLSRSGIGLSFFSFVMKVSVGS